ncbi:AAA family ATPase [Mycobacteroides abscessus]|uniref:AAA family ATPase n=1 Tax=Mycobacteroides abscessus TaxID=36809 RepID=UPI0005E1D0C9|nr:ATP-binding protein [Mycobacteroides abscessus]CPR69485.1 cell division protease ftsH-like protein [Mycobacteroides abscessus]CPU70631.1 cell division protease ftsH-like protein [Mycobacteroides abscessus]
MNISNGTRPITDVAAWLATHGEHDALRALGELLLGVTSAEVRAESADRFTLRHLGVTSSTELIDEEIALNAVTRVTAALALAELIAAHSAEVGPGEHSSPPSYTQAEIAPGEHRRHPQTLRAAFAAGTLSPAAVVLRIETRASSVHDPVLTVYATRQHQLAAQAVLDRLMERADALNPFRGRAVRATFGRGVTFTMIDLPPLSRDTVVVPQEVWREVDLGVLAVRDQHELLNAHGLGCRRGVVLVGPPGTGKSAVSAVVARELLGSGFTVIYVEARAGQHLLTAVVEEAQRLGGPVLLVLEDVDLYVRNRSGGDGGAGLSELLQAMDIQPDARILTLASTNDATTLDAAAIRTGRFDSIVTVPYPDRAAAARILTALVDGIPGEVDPAAVASRLPDQTSGSDLREIVRRAVLSGDGVVSTASLLNEIGSGRYRAMVPAQGQYL